MRRVVQQSVPVLLVAVLLVSCAGDVAPGPAASTPGPSTPPPAPVDIAQFGTAEDYASAMFEETNAARAAEGLAALAPSTCAQEQGALRAADLVVSGGELVHAPLDPVQDACLADLSENTAGENLSRAAAGPQDVVDAWMESPGHRSNILTPDFTELGIACTVVPAAGDDGLDEMLCSQIFLGA